MNIDLDRIRTLLDSGAAQAEQIINDPSKVDEVLIQLEEKLKEVPAVGEQLSEIPLMAAMVKSYVTKEYTEVSPKVVVLLLGSFIYLIKKKDLIPDNVAVFGIVDDIAVLSLALKLSEPELEAFSEWRKNRQ